MPNELVSKPTQAKMIADCIAASDNNADEAIQLVIACLVDQIEKAKARTRVEHDNLKADYLAGLYRQHGLTKRECEDRLNNRRGEIFGFELALSHLYLAVKED